MKCCEYGPWPGIMLALLVLTTLVDVTKIAPIMDKLKLEGRNLG
jgi:hypothetical protein